MRLKRDVGETLVEVLLTIVIIGLTVTALLSSLGAAGNAGNAQRKGVQVDAILRNYAMAVKTGAQACTVAGATYSVGYTAPLPFTVSGAVTACPTVSTPQDMTLTVSNPQGPIDSVVVRVRTP